MVLALSCGLILAGCAAPAPPPPVTQTVPAAAAAPPPAAEAPGFDGWYQGRRVLLNPGPGCHQPDRQVWFHVEGRLVEMLTRRRRHQAVQKPLLDGTVTPSGALALRGENGSRAVGGQIEGDRLVATDLGDSSRPQRNTAPCAFRYEAVRHAD